MPLLHAGLYGIETCSLQSAHGAAVRRLYDSTLCWFTFGPAMFSRFLLTTIVISSCMVSSGCAVMMAAKSPGKKDLDVLTPGMVRSAVVAELGPPVQSRHDQAGYPTDVFSFKQGYSLPVRVTRAAVHGAADAATIGLWEVVATPLEAGLQGESVKAAVVYDHDERVKRVEYFAGAHLANGEPTLASWLRFQKPQQTAVVEYSPEPTDPLSPGIMPASYSTETTDQSAVVSPAQ